MTTEFWRVDGVHKGKRLTELPITYLLWFVGSPIMRRSRWTNCRQALFEIRRRLKESTSDVESELIAGLMPRSPTIRNVDNLSNKAYVRSNISSK